MTSLVQNNIDKIADACRRHNVESLYLFGSAARENDFTEKSDIDLLVNFKEQPLKSNEDVFRKVNNYENLSNTLEAIFSRKIDLIQEGNIKNRFLRYFINKEKKLLYGLS
jgi:uncharacterized protein